MSDPLPLSAEREQQIRAWAVEARNLAVWDLLNGIDAVRAERETLEARVAQLEAELSDVKSDFESFMEHHKATEAENATLREQLAAREAEKKHAFERAQTLALEWGEFCWRLQLAQKDLPEEAAKVLRENLWHLYDSGQTNAKVEDPH